ncbi:MAG TPA: SDR family NAD(P)-dependent oxidoreductase, partial [Spirochaetales bacterium]|nr:SDR family NAD(P)-dependent oxidoreductase [Spirochaetales bacterium]
MKHILITGAAGGLGSSAAFALAKQGHKIYALDLNIEGLLSNE